MQKIFLLLSFVFLFSNLLAQKNDSSHDNNGAIRISADSLKWTDTKPPLPPGAKVAILEGNPKGQGHFTMRIKMPANYKIPSHSHPVDERATVITGTMYVGLGTTVDTAKAKRISIGGFYVNPAGLIHYAYTGNEETILQISTNGPWGSTYIDESKH